MAGIQPLPGGGNPWAQALPGFVQQLAMMKVAQNFKAKEAEIARDRADAQETRQLQKEGYRPSEAHKPDVEGPGGVGYMAPTNEVRYNQVPGVGVQPVIYQKSYGESGGGQPVKMGSITQPKAPPQTNSDKLTLNELKLQQQLAKEKQAANFKQGLEEISIYNNEKGMSRKITRNLWETNQGRFAKEGWTETKKEKAGQSEAELTRQALNGDKEANAILDAMLARKVKVAQAGVAAKTDVVDVLGTSQAILDGRENIENVKNVFGVAVQELVRKAVLAKEPKFNFHKPRLRVASIQSSLMQQEKQRGMMGSFVRNLDKQLERTDHVMKDVISRVGTRAVDLPLRQLRTKFVGSGHEMVLEAYLIEISNEIGKLSTGSVASVRELSTEAQERWAKIHDPNLSLKELQLILEETQTMGQMRLESTEEQIKETMDSLNNVRKPSPGRYSGQSNKPKSRFKILKVE